MIDPKGQELAVFKPLVGKKVGNILIDGLHARHAAVEDGHSVDAFREVRYRDEGTAGRLSTFAGLRQILKPTEALPARVVWTDEMNELQKAYEKIDAPMVTAISQGRSTLDWVIGTVQVAKVSNLGEAPRPVPRSRSACGLATQENTKAAMGTDPADTPPCHVIPRSTPGRRLLSSPTTAAAEVPHRARHRQATRRPGDDGHAARRDDHAAPSKHAGPPCFVYVVPHKKSRLWSRRCGYVGIAEGWPEDKPVKRRYKQHRRDDVRWCAEHERAEYYWRIHLDHRNMQVKKFPSRAAAKIEEARLIKELRPVWNIHHNGGNPDSNENLAKRAGAGRRLRDAVGEYLELGRDVRAVRYAKAQITHAERVQHQVEKRDQFVSAVTGGDLR